MEGTNEKLNKVFVDTGAMTTLQSSGGNLTLPGSEERKRIS
jgi:predicted ribosome-associated RNA-binding protein Tma20